MFSNQRKNSGIGGLFAVAAMIAAWLTVGTVMVNSYLQPHVREASGCQLVCRDPNAGVRTHG